MLHLIMSSDFSDLWKLWDVEFIHRGSILDWAVAFDSGFEILFGVVGLRMHDLILDRRIWNGMWHLVLDF